MAGLEYAMLSRASIGLFVFAVSATAAFAHAPGVTHTYERGEPVITVRLVPDEGAVAKNKRINALDQPAAHDMPSEEASRDANGEVADTAEPASVNSFEAPIAPESTPETSIDEPVGQGAAVSRYPSAEPRLKPNSETGVGGVLDLEPPASQSSSPRPMRLNSVDRQNRVADRAPRRQPRQERRQPRQAQPAAESVEAATPAIPDPSDRALLPQIIDLAPAPNSMQLPPAKVDERIVDGN